MSSNINNTIAFVYTHAIFNVACRFLFMQMHFYDYVCNFATVQCFRMST